MFSICCTIQDPNKRFGASLGALSGGRVGITGMCATNLKNAITISIRYSAVRRQFGPGEEEIPVIEYQLQVQFESDSIVIISTRVMCCCVLAS